MQENTSPRRETSPYPGTYRVVLSVVAPRSEKVVVPEPLRFSEPFELN